MKLLSIIIPVYNEERTILQVINRLKKAYIPVKSEVIIVDDGSTDSTKNLLEKINDYKVIRHKINRGKGAAVKTGIKAAKGDYIIIQDADLEYEPTYIKNMVNLVQENKSKVVYGTRLNRLPNLKGEEKTLQFLIHYIGNRFLSLLTSILYGQWITDMETGYKLFPKSAMSQVKLNARGFELEPEITAKLLKSGLRITEVSITTKPRSYDEGKKINTLKDGTKALWYLLKYRFVD